MKHSLIPLIVGLIMPLASSADQFQPLTYENEDGDVRICKGNTTTGDMLCVDSARKYAKVPGNATPKFKELDEHKFIYFKYTSPFSKKGTGLYAFFHYYNNKAAVRICVGDTASGQGICRDGTNYYAKSSSYSPTFKPGNAKVFWFHYFPWSKGQSAGTYAFTSYRNNENGEIRVCQARVANGETICVNGSNKTGSALGTGVPEWNFYDDRIIYYLVY